MATKMAFAAFAAAANCEETGDRISRYLRAAVEAPHLALLKQPAL
jgi:hypothetical protein